MPGTYDLGPDYFYGKDYVDLEGAGQGNTFVTGSTTGAFYYSGIGTTVKNLTFVNTFTGNWTGCIQLRENSKLENANIVRNITGTTSSSFTAVGVWGNSPAVSIANVNISINDVNAGAQNTGIF